MNNLDSETLKQMELYDPIKYLINKSIQTDIPQLYLNIDLEVDNAKPILFFLAGPSGSGKDTIMQELLENGLISHAITATTRERREGEDENSYIWMREIEEDESFEEYYENLIEEYDLIESNIHNNNIYGMPRQSLEIAIMSNKPVVIRTELNGLKTLTKNLENDFNLISIFLVPESYQQIWNRITDRDNREARIQKAVDEIKEAPQLVNFFILNKETPQDLSIGINILRESFKRLIFSIVPDNVD